MPRSKFYTGEEVARLLRQPATVAARLDQTVEIQSAGIVAVGTTEGEAKVEWGRLFSEMIRRPKG